MKCCFTGSRPQNLPWGGNEKDLRCISLKMRLESQIILAIDSGYTHFISGAALGVDQYALEILYKLKEQSLYSPIVVETAIPCLSQSLKWTHSQKLRYEQLISSANIQTIISNTYTETCMHDRNKYMCDQATLIIAVSSGKRGGTTKTISYAQSQNKQVIILHPLH